METFAVYAAAAALIASGLFLLVGSARSICRTRDDLGASARTARTFAKALGAVAAAVIAVAITLLASA